MVTIKMVSRSPLAVLLLTLQFTNTAAAPGCRSDSEGSGWRWDSQQSCIAESTALAGAGQPDALTGQPYTIQTGKTTHPICADAASDPDGDGFGWENQQSCIVVSTTPIDTEHSEAGTGQPDPDQPAMSSHPICANSTSDPDGDGFGWENSATCIVDPTGAEAVPESPPPSHSGPPACLSPSSDPDGDGWGWENQRSCIIAETPTPVEDTPVEETDTSGEDNPNRLIRFMAVGDSITHGGIYNGEASQSYRRNFVELMDAGNCVYRMVGSQITNYQLNGFNSPHESYAGHRTDDFLNGRNSDSGNNEGIIVALQEYEPDVVLLFLGTNDILQGQGINETTAELDQLVALILDSDAEVFVANITPVFRVNAQQRIEKYGDEIEAYVAQLANPRVTMVDVRSAFSRALILDDNLHPNEAGDAFVAEAYFNAVTSQGHCTRAE